LCDVAHAGRKLARLEIQAHDRIRAAAAAIARGRPIDRHRLLASLPHSAARRKTQLLLAAASPQVEVKRRVFERYLGDHALAEDWIVASLPYFNDAGHARLTLPFLAPALAAVPRLAGMKKIFFVDRWLESFLGGQHSAVALGHARTAFKVTALAPELAQKVREPLAELSRAVSIRTRWARRR
jgi:aminopeptidase N